MLKSWAGWADSDMRDLVRDPQIAYELLDRLLCMGVSAVSDRLGLIPQNIIPNPIPIPAIQCPQNMIPNPIPNPGIAQIINCVIVLIPENVIPIPIQIPQNLGKESIPGDSDSRNRSKPSR